MATPFIRFPGTTDNIFTVGDNLVGDADTAHMQQAKGNWTNSTLVAEWDQTPPVAPVFGDSCGRIWLAGLDRASGLIQGATNKQTVVSASTGYASLTHVYTVTPDLKFRFIVREFDSGDANVWTENGPFVTPTLGEWVPLSVVWTTQATAAYLNFRIEMASVSGSNYPTGTESWWDATCLLLGDEAKFVPSLAIVGSSFVSETADPTPVSYANIPPLEVGGGYSGDVQQWALHDGADAAAPIVAQLTALDALRALPL